MIEGPAIFSGPQTPEEIQFYPATLADIDDILQIQELNSFNKVIKDKTKEEIERSGFLVHLLTKEEITELLEKTEDVKIMVCRENGKVVGYIVGYTMKLWKSLNPNWIDGINFKEGFNKEAISDEQSIYLRHVAVSQGAKAGVGAKMSKELIKIYEGDGYTSILAEILKEPYQNRPSYLVHTRMGFKEIAEIEENYDGELYKWGLYKKDFIEN